MACSQGSSSERSSAAEGAEGAEGGAAVRRMILLEGREASIRTFLRIAKPKVRAAAQRRAQSAMSSSGRAPLQAVVDAARCLLSTPACHHCCRWAAA